MHKEVLNDDTRKAWEQCGFLNEKGFYLAGGTALALQLGHRISVDLDFFSDEPIKKTLLSNIEDNFHAVATVLFKTTNELTLNIQGVKITCLYYPFHFTSIKQKTEIVPLASIHDIALMKAYTLGRRQSLKDYIDLYCILFKELISLKEIIMEAKEKYGDAFNGRLFLEQLLYIDDLDDDVINWLWEPVSKEKMKEFFSNLITKEKDNII
jgi:hypothetical protein